MLRPLSSRAEKVSLPVLLVVIAYKVVHIARLVRVLLRLSWEPAGTYEQHAVLVRGMVKLIVGLTADRELQTMMRFANSRAGIRKWHLGHDSFGSEVRSATHLTNASLLPVDPQSVCMGLH